MSYPKWIYHKTNAPKIVTSEAEHAEAGEGWEETPVAFDKKSNEKAEKPEGDKTQGEQEKTPIQETDYTKWKVGELRSYLAEKGVAKEKLDGLKKDELISLIGAL